MLECVKACVKAVAKCKKLQTSAAATNLNLTWQLLGMGVNTMAKEILLPMRITDKNSHNHEPFKLWT